MGRGDSDNIPTKANSDQFRTPDKPVLSSKLKRAPARLGVSSLGTPAETSTSTSSHSTASASRSRSGNPKRTPTLDQTTLTQIEFVKRSQPDSDEDVFDYIGNSGPAATEVIEIGDDKELDNANDPPSASRIKRERIVKFDSAPSKLKRTGSGQIDVTSGKGRRKSGDKKDKGAQKDDNTLTQMKYVRRIDLEADEGDGKLEYAYITPKKRDTELQPANIGEVSHIKPQPTYISEPSSEHKRRKLSPFSEKEGVHRTEVKPETKVETSPSTPRKPIRTEIPSSQSPESPGVAFITSSQFRSATRSSEKRPLKKSSQPSFKESPLLYGKGSAPETVQKPIIDEKPRLRTQLPLPNNSTPRLSSPAREGSAGAMRKANEMAESTGDAPAMSTSKQRSSQRTVVYETDAETDYDDSEDDAPVSPDSPKDIDAAVSQVETHVEDELDLINIESQELPPPPVPEQETDSGPLQPDSNFLSDASICYQRVHPDTQFPLEPVPTINTQKMAELFPEESNGLRTITPLPSSSPTKTRQAPNIPMMVSETQLPHQDQPESQDGSRTQTEIVPESSPIARHENGVSLERPGPLARDVVIQVESSQPVDRAYRQTTGGQDSPPRKMLSRSQILTSSVMESIPIPGFWMSSQDSVGEPYSQPNP
ncbi:uncharacterized protein DSM5745_05389 [Aspergillus mulundensis]|uniref:Uncharacterized protein n=1 Tax=Aspergillus mulundensis TaxID=1810919 RepID=A0A3D8RWV3_9EURO|nr:Uncharacterized protein DSM5745_05389 [Aspergillus mulundensis]RDW78537.1 Uncharacterized protein DSM5745_05389 [Aspergillus mulundensis]